METTDMEDDYEDAEPATARENAVIVGAILCALATFCFIGYLLYRVATGQIGGV